MKITKVNKILTESAKKAFIDQSGSLSAFKAKIDAKAAADGCTDFYYFNSFDYAEPVKAAKAGDKIIIYTNDDYKTNCPELANFKNVVIKDITSEIKNEALTEAEETAADEAVSDEDIEIDDVLSASVSEIADAVQDAAEEASDGKETYSDAKAEKIATELKTAAQGLDRTKWAPLDVPSALTNALDHCLAKSMIAKKAKRSDGTDILITGLPGSGKTGITKQWAKDRGVNLFYLNAKNDDLGAILNGFPVPVETTDADGNTVKVADRAFSKSLDSLDKEKSVLFLDEFNRATPKLRAVLLTLINEHAVEGPGEDGFRHFDNLLFTIACINPSVPTDPGAMNLNDAEKSRFVKKLDWDSKEDDAVRYIKFYINKTIQELDPNDEDYAFLYVEHKKIYNLAMALLTDYRFKFDTRDDLLDLSNEDKTMLNQRAITDGLLANGSSKEEFLYWVDNESDFLPKNITTIHEILDSWIEPEVTAPTNGKAHVEDETAAAASTNSTSSDDSDDFDSLLDGTEEDEIDTDLFGSTASAAGKAAKVSAADAQNRIKTFDFTR